MSQLLSEEMLNSVRAYTQTLESAVVLRLNPGEHSKKDKLREFLRGLSSTSHMLSFEETPLALEIGGALTFQVTNALKETEIYFSGIPGGHEFSSLILAILQVAGGDLKLDPKIGEAVARIQTPVNFKSYVSLDCENCPDVVQLLNKFACLNTSISSETVDGGLFPEDVAKLGIQGVPTVFLNDEVFHVGRLNIARIMDRLREKFPEITRSSEPGPSSVPVTRCDVAIVGGGPAAISAAIYTARKGLNVTLVAEKLGGQVAETVGIENMISNPGTTGPKLTSDLKRHVEQYSLKIREGLSVTELQPGKVKRIKLDTDEIIEAVSVIVATGANWRRLNIPGEKENIGRGVAYCPHCDGPFFKDKDVAVVGGGNSGVEAALDLSAIAKTVTLLEFMPELKADAILIDRATSKKNIQVLTNVECLEVLSDSASVTGLRYRDRPTEKNNILQIEGMFVQIGLLPNSRFLSDEVKLNPHGEIVINRWGETSSEGIFACGDVTDVPYKQIIIAMGEGANVGLTTSEYVAAQTPVFEGK